MQIPKLVVFDVDGTLIDWDGIMSPSTAQVLAQLRQLGVPIAIATGRPMVVASQTLEHVGGADWMACGNGSVLFEVATGQLLRDLCLPSDVVVPLVEGLRRRVPGVGFAIELTDTLLEEQGFARRVPETRATAAVSDVLQVLPADLAGIRRVIPFHDDYDHRLDELQQIVLEFIDHRCQVQFGGLPIIDVSPYGSHKAAALQVLIDHLGIAVADVVAFGDGNNDVEMLEWAGTGVAMGNAGPRAKAAADHVTTDVTDDGIAVFLEPLLAAAI